MHPLIQAVAKKIGKAEYPHLKAAGGKLVCAHFMCRLAERVKTVAESQLRHLTRTGTILSIFFKSTLKEGKRRIAISWNPVKPSLTIFPKSACI